ncbi:MAG: hypothetical protein COB24_01430 [Hyphomicrobiales bacterium]|nr:MAG: hypothetical protein COB24_01430 [Hyphomicrobiales bacterium]
MYLVFVYGTLKRGFANHDEWMTPFKYIADGKTYDKFPLIVGGAYYSPILLNEQGNGHIVKGEFYEVDDDELATLDIIEGVRKAGGYERISIAALSGNVKLKAWIYVKDRVDVEAIHNELNGEYKPDARYIPDAQR